jgi:hypothetical protein
MTDPSDLDEMFQDNSENEDFAKVADLGRRTEGAYIVSTKTKLDTSN